MSHKKTHLLKSFAVCLPTVSLANVWSELQSTVLKFDSSLSQNVVSYKASDGATAFTLSFSRCSPLSSLALVPPHNLSSAAATSLLVLLMVSQPSSSCVCHLHLSCLVFRVHLCSLVHWRGDSYYRSHLLSQSQTVVPET